MLSRIRQHCAYPRPGSWTSSCISSSRRRPRPTAIPANGCDRGWSFHHTLASSSALILLPPHTSHRWRFPPPPQQQVRWKGRKAGASALDVQPRRPSKAQKKRHRKQLEREREAARHSPPGSKAGPRRAFIQETADELLADYQRRQERLEGGKTTWQTLAQTEQLQAGGDNENDNDEYGQDDFLLETLMAPQTAQLRQPNPEPIYYGHSQRFLYNQVADQMDQYHQALQEHNTNGLPQPQQQTHDEQQNLNSSNILHPPPEALLPTDRHISLAVRAFRDRRGTRHKPVGLALALEHLLRDLQVPLLACGEYTHHALLTCCRTTAEANKVIQMMHAQEVPLSAYTYSILVDLHAKLGDFDACTTVLQQMKDAGVAPTLAAYTSLLAACYKVCNNGRMPHSIRAKAGQVGWDTWMEIRSQGLDPDVMAYGAILRLCAARGHAERALNILEEMPLMEVPPTTLCFAAALQAVAKSHQIAVRYQRAGSKKNRRREQIAAHHGKVAREIVILAEAADVDIHDDGYVSALIMVAAAAGDSASAKAIYLASQVQRQMDHWRTIGSDRHLRQISGQAGEPVIHQREGQYLSMKNGGEDDDAVASSSQVRTRQQRHLPAQQRALSYGEREYGTDTRTLSAVLTACAHAVDPSGIGSMWAGRDNYGILDLTSLRLISTFRQPRYRNTDIPGMSRTEVGIDALVSTEETEMPRKRNDPSRPNASRTRKKYAGLYTDEDVGTNLDNLPQDMYRQYFDKDGILKPEFRASGDYPEYDWLAEMRAREQRAAITSIPSIQPKKQRQITSGYARANTDANEGDFENEDNFDSDADESDQTTYDDETPNKSHAQELYFDTAIMQWATRPKTPASITAHEDSNSTNAQPADEQQREEMNFDSDAMQWKTRPRRPDQGNGEVKKLTKYEADVLSEAIDPAGYDSDLSSSDEYAELAELQQLMKSMGQDIGLLKGKEKSALSDEDEEAIFQEFYSQLQDEARDSGDDEELSEEEAREFFQLMKDELDESGGDDDEGEWKLEDSPDSKDALPSTLTEKSGAKKDFSKTIEDLKDEWGEDAFDSDEEWNAEESNSATAKQDDRVVGEGEQAMPQFSASKATEKGGQRVLLRERENEETKEWASESNEEHALAEQLVDSYINEWGKGGDLMYEDAALKELQDLLPGMPLSRIERIRQAYQESLSTPSMLTLVPILREKMPDILTTKQLKKKNLRDARNFFDRAKEAGLIDQHMLNSMLQVETSAGSIDNALNFYDQEYKTHKKEPNAYTDRMVVQMLVNNRRLDRALAFKQRLEDCGRKLDILAYGSLIDYCGRHENLGSALMLLKECIAIYGAPPSEQYLKYLRLSCRQKKLEKQIGLQEMIGEDPMAWLREGEANLKREKSKRGNRNVNFLNSLGL